MNIEYDTGIEKLITGINKITKAASVTLGGAGNHVIIEDSYSSGSKVTKDGVTVIKSIYLDDPIENIGANFIKEVAQKTLEEVGDGTTSSSIIAQSLIVNSYNAIKEGASPAEIKKGINDAKNYILNKLETLSRKIENSNQTENIATISANNDRDLGKIISDAFDIAGSDGSISIERSHNNKTYIEPSKGYYLNTGLFNNHFANNKQKLISEYDNPIIVIYDKIINGFHEIRPIVDYSQKSNKPLIIFCQDCKAEAYGVLLNANMQGLIQSSIITIPGTGDNRRDNIDDLKQVTGARVFESQNSLSLFDPKDLGTCKKITITKTKTTIINDSSKELEDYILLVSKQVEEETNSYRKELAKSRLSSLNSKSVTLYIGGISETEINEKRDRIDDAVCATRAALIDGYVPGGGTTLMYISQKAESSENKGYSILMAAIQEPFKQILINAGYEAVYNVEIGEGLNVLTEKHENFYEKGIIDPTKVIKTCIDNAVSIATTVLSTKCIISSNR